MAAEVALTKQQKELLDYLGGRLQNEHELWTKRREFEGGTAVEKQQLFASLVPVYLVQSGDRYRLTLEGALEARYGEIVRDFLNRVLSALKQVAKRDRGFEQFSFKQLAGNELYLQNVIREDRDIRWLGHLIRIAGLCAEPDSAPEKGPWKVPADEEVLECKDVDALRALRTARSAAPSLSAPELQQRALDELVRLFLDGKNFYVEELALAYALRDLPKGQAEAASWSLIPALARGGSGRFTPTFRGLLSCRQGDDVRDLLKHFLSAIHTKWEKDGAFHQLLWRDVKAAASANAVVLDDKKLEWMIAITIVVWPQVYRAHNGPPDAHIWGRPDDLKEIVDNAIRSADELLAMREKHDQEAMQRRALPMRPASLRDKLRSLTDELRAVQSYPWANVEVLIQRAKPLVRTEFREHVDEFAKLCETPKWAMMIRWAGGGSRWDDEPERNNFAEADAAEEEADRRIAAEARNRIVAFLDGLLEIPEPAHDPPATETSPLELVIGILERFPAVARALATRNQKREPLAITDEYDVQYILGALLAAHFDDVRPEEWTPSYAGKSSRMDFLLKRERIVVETKFARSGHTDKEIADELIIDKERYKRHPECDVLVCFVYDPSHVSRNPVGLEDDLAQESGPKCVVVVRPR